MLVNVRGNYHKLAGILATLPADDSIQTLDFYYKNFHELSQLAVALSNNDALKNLASFSITINKSGSIDAIVSVLIRNATLQIFKIDYEKNKIDYVDMLAIKSIARLIRSSFTLRCLEITKFTYSDEGMRIFAHALKLNTSIRDLKLSYTEFTPQHLQILFAALCERQYPLQLLDFGYNECFIESKNIRIFKTHGKENFAVLLEYLQGERVPLEVNLNDNCLGEDELVRLLDVVTHNPHINSVSIAYNHVGDQNGNLLGSILATNDTLTKLEISHPIMPVIDALEVNNVLTELKIAHWKGITRPEWLAMFSALKYNSGVRTLYFSNHTQLDEHNDINMLKSCMETNYTLEALEGKGYTSNQLLFIDTYFTRNRRINAIIDSINNNFIGNCEVEEINTKLHQIYRLVGDNIFSLPETHRVVEAMRLLYAAASIRTGDYIMAFAALKKTFTHKCFHSADKVLLTEILMTFRYDYTRFTVYELFMRYYLLYDNAPPNSVEHNLAYRALVAFVHFAEKHQLDDRDLIAADAHMHPVTVEEYMTKPAAVPDDFEEILQDRDFISAIREEFIGRICWWLKFSVKDIFVPRNAAQNIVAIQNTVNVNHCSLS